MHAWSSYHRLKREGLHGNGSGSRSYIEVALKPSVFRFVLVHACVPIYDIAKAV